MEDYAIKVDNVTKAFRLPLEKNSSLKSSIINFYRTKRGYEVQRALNNVSLQVNRGEFFGIVGRNGSGKSTLLKLLAGIYSPTKGTIHVNGTLTPFIELGVGFNPELTGRENVFLNGALLGFSRKEMQVLYKDIVEFAELDKFMDQKLKNYSSGMQVRLAFSIAIRSHSDILLIDEVLAVGDAEFQRKCFEYFGKLKEDKKTVVFVSHDMESVRKYCDRAILIDGGSALVTGNANEVISDYFEHLMRNGDEENRKRTSNDLPLGMSTMVDIKKGTVDISNSRIENESGSKVKRLTEQDDSFFVKFTVKINKDTSGIIPGVIITNDLGEFVTASNSKWANKPADESYKKGDSLEISFKIPNIYEKGDYKVSLNIVSSDFNAFYGWENEVINLNVDKKHTTGAKANPRYEVQVVKNKAKSQP
jgi:ABC-2 type transport system ATP-binding protein